VAGISMGGTIAMQYAADYPGDISRLVLAGTFAAIPAEYAEIRDAQLKYIETR
jgi:pimeloyl-ACP methyl ester carboxylesterase